MCSSAVRPSLYAYLSRSRKPVRTFLTSVGASSIAIKVNPFDFSVERGNSVRTYVDCHWITTQVLQNHWLTVPENADLIVGYMFQVLINTS